VEEELLSRMHALCAKAAEYVEEEEEGGGEGRRRKRRKTRKEEEAPPAHQPPAALTLPHLPSAAPQGEGQRGSAPCIGACIGAAPHAPKESQIVCK